MDIQNPNAGARSHRHFVAIPLGIALSILSLLVAGSGMQRAALFLAQPVALGAGETLALTDTVRVAAEEEGALLRPAEDRVLLDHGAVLVAAHGIARLGVGRFTVLGLGGAFFLSQTDSATSVAALTVPVLVADPSGGRLIVPAGFQWTSEGPAPLPPADESVGRLHGDLQRIPLAFLSQRLQVLAALPPPILPSAVASEPQLHAIPWQLPQAAERRTAEQEDAFLGYLRSLIEHGDAVTLSTFLSRPEMSAFLGHSDRAQEGIVALLEMNPSRQSVQMAALQTILSDADLLLLASFHPLLQEAAWRMPPAEDAPADADTLRLFTLPLADAGQDAFSDRVTRRWEMLGEDVLRRASDPVADCELLLRDGRAALERFAAWNFPERLVRYADLTLKLTEPYARRLSPQAFADRQWMADRAAMARMEGTEEQVQPQPQPQEEGSAANAASSSSADSRTFSPDAIRAQVYELLRQAGALFTVNTTITGQASGVADVKGIVFSSPSADAFLDFSLDTVTSRVSRIMKDGKPQPYALPWENFVDWAKKE